MHGSGVESIHNMICRIETILANISSKSGVGRALGDDPLMRGNNQTLKIAVTDVDRLLEPALAEGCWQDSPVYQLPPHLISSG